MKTLTILLGISLVFFVSGCDMLVASEKFVYQDISFLYTPIYDVIQESDDVETNVSFVENKETKIIAIIKFDEEHDTPIDALHEQIRQIISVYSSDAINILQEPIILDDDTLDAYAELLQPLEIGNHTVSSSVHVYMKAVAGEGKKISIITVVTSKVEKDIHDEAKNIISTFNWET